MHHIHQAALAIRNRSTDKGTFQNARRPVVARLLALARECET